MGSAYSRAHGDLVSTRALQRVCGGANATAIVRLHHYRTSPRTESRRSTLLRCSDITLPGRGIFEWTWAVGIRNSHDKTFPAGLVAGTKVFCCDNLAFSGEVQISRKHTRFAERDLSHLTARAVGQLGSRLRNLDERILTYNETRIDDQRAHDIVIRALDAGAITTIQVPEVLGEWRRPSHPEFLPRTAWSLFNADRKSVV